MSSEHVEVLRDIRYSFTKWSDDAAAVAALDAAIASLSAPPSAPVGVEWLVERMRQAPTHLWTADLVGQKISVERMRDILAFALAQQPAAVDESFVERFCGRWFQLTSLSLDRPIVRACLTEALAAQQEGSDDR